MPQTPGNTVFHETEWWCQLKLAPRSTLHNQSTWGTLPTGHQWEEGRRHFSGTFSNIRGVNIFFKQVRGLEGKRTAKFWGQEGNAPWGAWCKFCPYERADACQRQATGLCGPLGCFTWPPQLICTCIFRVTATFTMSEFSSSSLTCNSQPSKKI